MNKIYQTLNIEPFPVEDFKTGAAGLLAFMAILGMAWGTIGGTMFVVWVTQKVLMVEIY